MLYSLQLASRGSRASRASLFRSRYEPHATIKVTAESAIEQTRAAVGFSRPIKERSLGCLCLGDPLTCVERPRFRTIQVYPKGSAGAFGRGYDEPAILSYAISSFCPTSADGLQVLAG